MEKLSSLIIINLVFAVAPLFAEAYQCRLVTKNNRPVSFSIDTDQEQVVSGVQNGSYSVKIHWIKYSGLISLDIHAPNGQKSLSQSKGNPPFLLSRLDGRDVYAVAMCNLK